MISNVKSKKVLAKTPKDPIANSNPFKKGIFFIPLIICGGFLYSTSNGLTNINDFDTNDFSWQEIIADGQGDLQVCWEGSTTIESRDETLVKDGVKDKYTTQGVLKYKVGKYGWGYNADTELNFNIAQDASYNDFNVMFDEEEFELTVKSQDLNDIDFKKFRFYCFPERSNKKVFYISNLSEHRDINDSNKIISYTITFTHLTNKLQKSGKSIEEYFHFSMIGNGYPWPVVDRNNNTIYLDENVLRAEGINEIQEEEYNASIHNNTAFIGWELKQEGEELFAGDISEPKKLEDGTYEQVFYKPTVLLPHSFTSGEASILNRRALPESDISFINTLDFTEDNYTTWTDYWTQLFSNDFSVKYSGECSYKERQDLGTISKLNDKFTIGGNYFQKGINNPYVSSEFGEVPLNQLSWQDINMFNYYCCNDIYTLPFSFQYHILNQIKQWPIIGGIVNMFMGGYSYGWDESYRRIKDGDAFNKNICGITSQSMIDIAQKNWKRKSQENNKFFLNDFYKKNSDDRFNANNRSLILKYQLTKNITTLDQMLVSKDLMSTSWLGQTHVYVGNKDADGNKIIEKALSDGNNIKLNSNFRLVSKENLDRKFIVCGISNQNCFAESQKYTFYNLSRPMWVGAFLTNSNFRDNSRDWTNWYTINPMENLPFTGATIEYPIDTTQSGDISGDITLFTDQIYYNETKTHSFEWFLNSDVSTVEMEKDFPLATITSHVDLSFNSVENINSKKDLADYLINKITTKGITVNNKIYIANNYRQEKNGAGYVNFKPNPIEDQTQINESLQKIDRTYITYSDDTIKIYGGENTPIYDVIYEFISQTHLRFDIEKNKGQKSIWFTCKIYSMEIKILAIDIITKTATLIINTQLKTQPTDYFSTRICSVYNESNREFMVATHTVFANAKSTASLPVRFSASIKINK